jgi:hypothetical protein
VACRTAPMGDGHGRLGVHIGMSGHAANIALQRQTAIAVGMAFLAQYPKFDNEIR